MFVVVLVDWLLLMFERVEESLPWFEASVVTVLVFVELLSELAVPLSLALTPGPVWVTVVEESVVGSVVWAWACAVRPKASDRAVTSKVLFMQIPLGCVVEFDWRSYQLNLCLCKSDAKRGIKILKSLINKHNA